MGEFEVKGPGALAFLQRVTSNDVAKLADGQAQYSALPLPNGAPVDDVIVYRRGAERFLMVVNAGNIEKDFAWLQAQEPEGCDARRTAATRYALIALQGPRAQAILQPLTAIDLPAIKLLPLRGRAGRGRAGHRLAHRLHGRGRLRDLRGARARAPTLWQHADRGGQPRRACVPAGLGARDTLRLEAQMCLYGNDMDETTTLVEAAWAGSCRSTRRRATSPAARCSSAQKRRARRASWWASRWWAAASRATATRCIVGDAAGRAP